jgi:hypothetical protein
MPDDAPPPPRELILLSPYRLPAQHAAYLSNDDVAGWLNAMTALWHPALAHGAKGPPHVGSPYDYEQPTAGHVYAIPESPPLILPDDWDQRVRAAGAVAFRATPDRAASLRNLREAVQGSAGPPAATVQLLGLDADRIGAFFGLGFGYLVIEGLFEAMQHDNLIATAELWQDVQQAVAGLLPGAEPTADADAYRHHLQSAAQRLLSAREVLYPVVIHLLDLALLDGERLGEPLPAAFERGLPLNVLAPAILLDRLRREQPERLEALRQRIASGLVEVCGGCYLEREDALLPVQSQLWNLLKGQAVSRDALAQDVKVYGRKRFAAHAQLPLLLATTGLNRALLLAFSELDVLPAHRATVISWPSPDGKQIEAFTRAPHAADNPQTFFHAAHHLHRTIMQDQAATFALLHAGAPAGPWYRDWIELSRLAPVLGQWTTLSRYFADVLAGEYASAASPDEFHGDYLSERTGMHSPQPVSGFARHARWRRRVDTAWTLAALHRGLAGRGDTLAVAERLSQLEDQVESAGPRALAETMEFSPALAEIQKEAAEALAGRLLSRASSETPGYLVLNPCSFARRLALELDDVQGPLPVSGPVKACQVDGSTTRLVVEVPSLGFAWFPRSSPPGTPPPASRMRLADERCVRNEFFEAEVDLTTGGLRGIRDHRTRANRLAQQLVFNPGSTMRVKSVKTTSSGPALGEIVSEGVLLDDQQQALATFRQRIRAWLGRPVLDLRIEITPRHVPQGYPWHAYYGARFAWRDERSTMLRSVNGTGYVTTHTRPETADYLEWRLGGQSTVLFPGGLPFHQRHGARMLDVILVPEGETAQTFDLALGLERDYPIQTALGMITPVPLVPTSKGPPHIGTSGWLFHLDAPNLMLMDVRPAPDGADGIVARLLECTGQGSHAELRCVRDPQRALLLDASGSKLMDLSTQGDAVTLEVVHGDLAQLRVDFS